MQINIPEVLIHLRSQIVQEKQSHIGGQLSGENLAMQTMRKVFQSETMLRTAHKLARIGQGPFVDRGVIPHIPGMRAWTQTRDLRAIPKQSFREWWKEREEARKSGGRP
jgi:L-lactate dehydrogenase complex protein LldF